MKQKTTKHNNNEKLAKKIIIFSGEEKMI